MSDIKPRVLIVSHGHPSLPHGGAELLAHDLFGALDGTGLADAYFLGCVTALHRPAGDGAALRTVNGAAREFLLHVGAFDPFMLAHGLESRALEEFGALLDRLRPDVVHFHHLFLIGAEALAMAKLRCPEARVVMTLHDYAPICHHDGLMVKTRDGALCAAAAPDACHACFNDIASPRFALRKRHLMNMLACVDRFIAPSHFLRERYAEWGLDRRSMSYLPNGVPEAAPPANDDAPETRNRFAYFGNIAPHKGLLVALDAVSRIAPEIDFTFTFHGAAHHQDAGFVRAFDKAVKRAGRRVFIAGGYDRGALPALMAAADWVVVPSIWWENAPLTILEAFRHNRPVIASDSGGMAELIEHGTTGLLFRTGDAGALARTIERALGEAACWDRLSAEAPRIPTTEDIARQHAALYADENHSRDRKSA